MKLKPGIYNIYKPSGPSSHDIVNRVRKITGVKRVGHAGTLDPFAEGVLIVAIGREYTKKLAQFLKQDKTYKATIKLGATSDTYDLTGKIQPLQPKSNLSTFNVERFKPSRKEVKGALKFFKGEVEQIPPPFSAIKIKGKKAYELARKGIRLDLKPRKIKIYKMKILKYKWPYLEIETRVSSGTYIRSLAHDLGQVLKTGGYLEKLYRTKVGKYDIKNAIKITAELAKNN